MYRISFKPLVLALLALLLVACQGDEDTAANGQQEDILSRFNSDGKAWMTLEIPLGGQTMTRSTTFDDGQTAEYAVSNAYLLLFAGSDEQTATFASAYSVTPSFTTSENEQITYKALVSISDDNINTGDNLYAFVLLNNNPSAISSFSASSVTFANGGAAATISSGSTLSNLQAVTIADYYNATSGYVMTNAVLADKPGGSVNPVGATIVTLTKMTADHFYATQAEAEANPAAHINVERLAAKTTVVNGLSDYTVRGNTNIDFESSDFSFALDNYNTATRMLKHVSSDWLTCYHAAAGYRMVEQNAIETTNPLLFRTYWAEDANYSGNSGLTYVNHAAYVADGSTITWNSLGSTTPQYCAENTFDVNHMQDDCTTSVLVRLQLNGGTDFYSTSVTGSDVIYQAPSNTISEEGTGAGSSFAPRRSTYVSTAKTIDEYLREWLMQTNGSLRNWVNTYAAGDAGHITISVTGNTVTGTATATVKQTARSASSTGGTAFTALGLDTYVADNIEIKYYKDGYCYYRVPIKHFGDEQTPWASAGTMTASSPSAAYNNSSDNYLGRYGMVRNNWYNISVRSVTHVGSPIIPALTQQADDTVEQLLNATLQISGWEAHNDDL